MELATLIAEEKPLVEKLSRGFARKSEVLLSPEDLEQEGYLFLCKFYKKVQKKYSELEIEAVKALSYRSLKNFYISLYRKFTRRKRTAEIVSLDFPIPTFGDPFKSLIFQEHLENLRGSFGGLEKEVFEILVGENGSFLGDMGNLWRGNGHSPIKVRQTEIANWLRVPQFQVGGIISTIKEKAAREFNQESVYKVDRGKNNRVLQISLPEGFLQMDSLQEEAKILQRFAAEMAISFDSTMSIEEQTARVLDFGRMATISFLSEELQQFLKYNEGERDELECQCSDSRAIAGLLSRSPKTKEFNMFGVPEDEDCFGKMYDETATECQTCEQWKECNEVKKEVETVSSKKQKKAKQEKRQFAAKSSEKREEEKAKKTEFKTKEKVQPVVKEKEDVQPVTEKKDTAQSGEKIDRKVVNPYHAGTGAACAFSLLVEGGTKNELIERLGKVVRNEGLKIDPKKRMNRVIADLRRQAAETLKPYELIEEGEGGWKTYRAVKRERLQE